MPDTPAFSARNLTLTGNHWYIQARDVYASSVVDALGKTMSLTSASLIPHQFTGEQWLELRVFVDHELDEPLAGGSGPGPYFCVVPPPSNNARLALGMSLIALAIAQAELTRGGLLIHGALAKAPENIGGGIILAGPAEVGKTTASNRLPSPWQSLSDDTTFVGRDKNGNFFAHPWPTWSRFFNPAKNKEGFQQENWEVQNGIPLRAIYFLKQAEQDQVQPLSFAQALTYLLETVKLVSSPLRSDLPIDQIRNIHEQQFAAAEDLLLSIPAYGLHLSLTGNFWKNIEETLSPIHSAPSPKKTHVHPEIKFSLPMRKTPQVMPESSAITVCYSGPSMNPTLRTPDILQVIPYAEKSVQQGDIVYYLSPIDGQHTIHRVVRITADGIYTCGDKNTVEDQYILQQEDIIGRVTSAWRYGKYRKISGGTLGLWGRYWAVFCNRMIKFSAPILHGMYHGLASSSFLKNSLPCSMQPRVVVFKQRYLPPIFKILVKGKEIGRYDDIKNIWLIERPWRLIVDETKLPVIAESSPIEEPVMHSTVTSSEISLSKAG